MTTGSLNSISVLSLRGSAEHRGRARDFHTDKFRTVTLGDLAGKKLGWVTRGPHRKYVKDEIARLSGDHQGEGRPEAGPSRPGLAFADAGAGLGDPGAEDDVQKNLAALEKELAEGHGPEAEDCSRETSYG